MHNLTMYMLISYGAGTFLPTNQNVGDLGLTNQMRLFY